MSYITASCFLQCKDSNLKASHNKRSDYLIHVKVVSYSVKIVI